MYCTPEAECMNIGLQCLGLGFTLLELIFGIFYSSLCLFVNLLCQKYLTPVDPNITLDVLFKDILFCLECILTKRKESVSFSFLF